MVIAAVKRGNAVVEYKVEGVTEARRRGRTPLHDHCNEERYGHLRLPADRVDPQGPVHGDPVRGKRESGQKWKCRPPSSFRWTRRKSESCPQGWSAAKTGEGPGSVWKVVEDTGGKKVLAQTSDQGPNRFFNLCVAENDQFHRR